MTKDEYLALITSEHSDKPKFGATVSASVTPLVTIQDVLKSLITEFDLDFAEGKQLDVVGEWVGFYRRVKIPLEVYFSFDTGGLGFDQGSWKGQYDPDNGLTELDDETYRTMIRAKIAANAWDGTMSSLNDVYSTIMVGTGITAFAIDNQDMSMYVCLVGKNPSKLVSSLLKNGYFPLKPCGVRIEQYLKPSVESAPLFGFDVHNSFIAGFDTGVWAVDVDALVYPVLDVDFILDYSFLA